MLIYLIGSMRNPEVQQLAGRLREIGHDVFDDWASPGENTDEWWFDYEKARGRSFTQALRGKHAQNVFEFDKRNLEAADAAVLVLPAGRSAHLELGYEAGLGKETHIILDGEPDRFDVMYCFADHVWDTQDEFVEEIAQRAGVGVPAVKQWRIRYPDFPTPDWTALGSLLERMRDLGWCFEANAQFGGGYYVQWSLSPGTDEDNASEPHGAAAPTLPEAAARAALAAVRFARPDAGEE